MDKGSLQLLLAQGMSIERIAKRFRKNPAAVSYWMKKHGLESPYKEKHAAKGGIERERLEELIATGASITQIATQVGRSKATVRHWLRRYGLRTRRSQGTDFVAAAREAGLAEVVMQCPRHGETQFALEGRSYYRCKRCRAESVVRHRRKLKAALVREAGGECAVCGYSRDVRALQFHHRDPTQKRLALSGQGVTYSLEVLRAEAEKCVLLCANCHAEVEGGALAVPLEF